jgi:hypothetical protein
LNRKFSIALSVALGAVLALPVLAFDVGTASADRRVRIRGGGGGQVHVRGSARVRVRGPARYSSRYRTYRPRVRYRSYRPYRTYRPTVRYRLRIGGGFYYGHDYGYSYAAPPSCDYECGHVHYASRPVPQPVAVTTVIPDRFPRFGIGLFAGGMNVEDREASSDIGVIGRFRLTRSLALEGEIAKSELEDGSRIDRRLGATLLWDLSPRRSLSPHLLVGFGAVRADIDSEGRSTHADQGYGEIGVGLGWRLSRHLEISADVRAGVRDSRSDDPVVFSTVGSEPLVNEDEGFTRGRLAAMLYF